MLYEVITCHEIFSIQVAALAKRVAHTRAKSLVIGISGGLDSTLALFVITSYSIHYTKLYEYKLIGDIERRFKPYL